MDIEVEQIGNAEEESKGEMKRVASGNLKGLIPTKKSSIGSSQGSAIDDNCSMDDQEEFLGGGIETIFDNFSRGLDLNDSKSSNSEGNDENADVFEETIMFKTKKKSCKTYWLQLLGIDAFFYKKKTDNDHDFMHCLKSTYIK